MSQNVYVELMQVRGESEICVTSLKNRVMPFVRFQLEDRGTIKRNVSCACGKCGDILTLQPGRSNEWIRCRDGDRIHSYLLIQLIHQVNHRLQGGVIQFQIIQEDYDAFVVLLVLEEEEEFEWVQGEVIEGIRKRLGEHIRVNVALKKEILPSIKTGKLASFIWGGE